MPYTLPHSPYLDRPLRTEAEARAEIAERRRQGFRAVVPADETRLRRIEAMMAGERSNG